MKQEIEPQYAKYITAYNQFMQPAMESALQIFSPSLGSKGLDAGCGPGDLFQPFSDKVGPTGKVICIDLSTAHLKEAAELAKNLKPIEVWSDPIDISKPLIMETNSLDWVWCADVLWPSAFDNQEEVIGEFSRVTRPGGTIALFCNGWQRTSLLTGYRHLEFDLIKASDLILRPSKSKDEKTDIEYMAGWFREAGLHSVQVTAHTVSYAWPLPPSAKDYITCVLQEDYLPALEVLDYDVAKKSRFRNLLSPAHEDFLPNQEHYFCVKTGILVVGKVG